MSSIEYSSLDHQFMTRALELADKASSEGEVPVGAVLVENELVIGEGYNQSISVKDATAHAEILAIRDACQHKSNYRLPVSTLYLTLEPCAMCAGAIIHARIERVVIATNEPRAGAAGSIFNVLENEKLNHQCIVQLGLKQELSAARLKQFFRARR